MKFDEEDLKQFKDLWFQEFGERIDDAKAFTEMNRLMVLINFVLKTVN